MTTRYGPGSLNVTGRDATPFAEIGGYVAPHSTYLFPKGAG